MQFANDITPLTLASTATLRACLSARSDDGDPFLNLTECAATEREIVSRFKEVRYLDKSNQPSIRRDYNV